MAVGRGQKHGKHLVRRVRKCRIKKDKCRMKNDTVKSADANNDKAENRQPLRYCLTVYQNKLTTMQQLVTGQQTVTICAIGIIFAAKSKWGLLIVSARGSFLTYV